MARNESEPLSYHRPRRRLSRPSMRDGQFLGRGGEKLVHATRRNGILVAVMSSPSADLTAEAQLMMKLTQNPHPHLLPLLAIESDVLSRVSMVAPIARYGSMLDLTDHLEFEGAVLTSNHVNVVMDQVSQAVYHLDALGLDHGDLHARNVLVFRFDLYCPLRVRVKLGDFGCAKRGSASPCDLMRLEQEMRALLPAFQNSCAL